MFLLTRKNHHGFTLLELSVVLLLITALTIATYPAVMKRYRQSEIDRAITEAQQIADFAEDVRTKWLLSTSVDPVTGAFNHTYNTLPGWQPINSLPFDGVNIFPDVNSTGGAYGVEISNSRAAVVSHMRGYSLSDFAGNTRVMSYVDGSYFGYPTGTVVSFAVDGRPSFHSTSIQTRKARFDKVFLYQESIR